MEPGLVSKKEAYKKIPDMCLAYYESKWEFCVHCRSEEITSLFFRLIWKDVPPKPVKEEAVVVNDTQSDSIQYLNFAKKWFIQYSIQYRFTQDSIQNIIQFKKKSADSIQKIIQFNSQEIINTGQIGKVPKNCPKSVQNRQREGDFPLKMANIDSKVDSFIHFKIKFNSKDYSI